MKKYVKTYCDYFNYGEQDMIVCEVCSNQAVDIHHIEPRGMGGRHGEAAEETGRIENLIGLCRDDHNKAERREHSREYLSLIHKKFMEKYNNARVRD